MSNVILTLGGVPFQDMEVPEKISFGGKQRVAVQNFIGGGRVVDALGLDDGVISFAGIFSGSDAVSRAQSLNAVRASGATLPLVWDSFFYNVVIEEFSAEYRKTNFIPFSIKCVVVSDLTAGPGTPVANLIGNDLSAAAAFSAMAGVSLAGLNATGNGGFAVVQGAIAAAAVIGGTAFNNAALALNDAADAGSGIAAIGALSSASSKIAGLSGMSGYVNRAANNLADELL